MREPDKFDISSAGLHILAMVVMLCDYLGMVLFPQAAWMRSVGRLAFPIFAFLLVEGFCHTKNFTKYAGRMFVCALIAEAPFDLMGSGRLVDFSHQNVLWTFLIALALMWAVDANRKLSKDDSLFMGEPSYMFTSFRLMMVIIWIVVGFGAGEALATDYGGAGVLMVLVFYFFHERTPASLVMQFACLFILNAFFVPSVFISVFGYEILQQTLAILALPLIWLYRGRQGYHSQGFQYLYYAFYPCHALILWYCGLVF